MPTHYNRKDKAKVKTHKKVTSKSLVTNPLVKGIPMSSATTDLLEEANAKIKELTEILIRVQEEPLMLTNILRITDDKAWAYLQQNDKQVRIKAVPNLHPGDEVLVHPKSMQIVELLGKPPLAKSRFAPHTLPNVSWSDIGGLEEAKADLMEAIELPHKNKGLFSYYNKRPIKGILLSGPTGCGKSMLGKAAATALAKIHDKASTATGFLYVKGPEILNQYVGQTEQTIRNIFDDAKRHKEEHGYPAIVFIDEAEAILGARDGSRGGSFMARTIVPMFLTEMDGMEESAATVIIATNMPGHLDPAVVRDGRIDRKISVTRPDLVNGTRILEINFKNVPLDGLDVGEAASTMAHGIYADDKIVHDDMPLRDIVNGAMLANCVDIAASFALRRDLVNKKKTGVMASDISNAVDRIYRQSTHVRHNIGTHETMAA